MEHHPHQLPNAKLLASLNIDDLMSTTRRLTDILAEESAYLEQMRVQEIVPLQDEKLRLTKQLETYQAMLAVDQSIVLKADAARQEELLLLTDDLAFTVEENFRRTAVARAVNQRVMQAVMEVVNDSHRTGTYDRQGQAAMPANQTLSINLNEKA